MFLALNFMTLELELQILGLVYYSLFVINECYRIIASGHGSSGRTISIISFEETLLSHKNYTISAGSFNSLISTQYPIVNIPITSLTISNIAYTNYSLSFIPITEVLDSDQFESDVSYWLRDYYAYNLTHNTYIEKDISLTCSVNGGTSITHTIVANGANQIPSWVSINAVNSKLLITTPLLTSETNFTFAISSYVSTDSKAYVRNVYLQVIVPQNKTSSSSSSTQSTVSKKSSVSIPISTYIILAVAFLMEGIVSLLNLSTSASFWLIIGQYQLLTILPLVGSYMPSDISDY